VIAEPARLRTKITSPALIVPSRLKSNRKFVPSGQLADA
jgi:hypothetical protein